MVIALLNMGMSRKPAEPPKPLYEIGKAKGFTYKCVDCNSDEVGRIARAQGLIYLCMASDNFEKDWASFKRIEQANGVKDIAAFIRNSGLDGIKVQFYWPRWYQSKSVVGYTSDTDSVIHLNKAFRGKLWTNWDEASNLFHESLHKIGFDHDFTSTERRPFSVPYLGNKVIEMCESRFTSANKN